MLLEAIAKQIQGQPSAAFGLPGRKISKPIAAIAASVIYERIIRGPNLMPDTIEKPGLNLKNPFCDWGLDTFEDASYKDFERTDFLNAIKRLVEIGCWWKMAASIGGTDGLQPVDKPKQADNKQ